MINHWRREFLQTDNVGAFRDVDEQIRFLGQKVKCQGRVQTKYGHKSTLGHVFTAKKHVMIIWIDLFVLLVAQQSWVNKVKGQDHNQAKYGQEHDGVCTRN